MSHERSQRKAWVDCLCVGGVATSFPDNRDFARALMRPSGLRNHQGASLFLARKEGVCT